ncbi:MAG: hypothetical protein JNM89_11370 [Hyphomicrobiaceae bacterium]|nr:hypothetical protein [Hyphomicrobiaceae bacterium]
MSPALTGATIGAVFGVGNFAVLRWMAERAEGPMPTDDSRRRAGILRIASLVELVTFPVLGYVLGPFVLS